MKKINREFIELALSNASESEREVLYSFLLKLGYEKAEEYFWEAAAKLPNRSLALKEGSTERLHCLRYAIEESLKALLL